MTRSEDDGHSASSTLTDSAARELASFTLENSTQVRGGARPDLLEQAAKMVATMATRGQRIPASAAWRLGAAHHVRGEYGRAIECFAAAEGAQELASATDRSLVAACHSSALWAQGKVDEGRALSDEALALAAESGDHLALAIANVSQALVFAAEGKRTENRRAYETALVHAVKANDSMTIVRIRGNLGSMHSEEARSEEALTEIDHAIALADATDVGLMGVVPYLSRAEVLLSLGRLDEALAEARFAVEAYRAVGAPMHVFALMLEADIHRIRGNATRAQVTYREAISVAERTGNAQVLAAAFAGLARTLIADDRAAAVECAEHALAQLHALGVVAAQLAAGWVALVVDDTVAAISWARHAITEAGRRHDVAALADALELGAISRWRVDPESGEVVSMLAEAASIWNETADVIRIATNRALRARVAGDRISEDSALRALQALGVRADIFRIAGPLQAIGRADTHHTEVRTLGSFAVVHQGEAMANDAWPSRKSREVVKILASRRGRPLSREALGELLWPGVRDASPRLSVALSNARLALDPARKHPADYFISSSHSQLRLDPATVRVDVAEFEQVARVALKAVDDGAVDALDMLEAAAALYPAPFLADEADADWAAEVRDEVRDLATTVKRALVRLLSRSDDLDGAISWLVSLLNDDPYDGTAHQNLIKVLARAQRFSEAQHAYRRYTARMVDLDVEPVSMKELVGSRLGT